MQLPCLKVALFIIEICIAWFLLLLVLAICLRLRVVLLRAKLIYQLTLRIRYHLPRFLAVGCHASAYRHADRQTQEHRIFHMKFYLRCK